jgi:glycosyltransferase involved in cell wall biosynthesis
MTTEKTKKVAFAIPTVSKPYQQCLDSLEASLPLIEAAGWDHCMVNTVGNPYISAARSIMLRKAMDAKVDVVVFIDHDLSWRPQDLLKLLEAEGDLVAGTYRFKKDEEEYMGALIPNAQGTPIVRESDGALLAHSFPAGFLKITKHGVNRFMKEYPELLYGDRFAPHVDLFQHGAHDFVWIGEDYSLCRRWREKCGQLWIVPNLNLTHHTKDQAYEGNYHAFLLAQPGGSNDPARTQE